MGRAGENNRTLCHMLELKCSQVAGEWVSIRMTLRLMNEGQVGNQLGEKWREEDDLRTGTCKKQRKIWSWRRN